MANTINTPVGASAPSSTASPTKSATETKDTFLKLLVAQLKYQNPMSPTDGTQFLQQTAQFTMVEKLEDIAKQSADLLTAQHNTEATAMLGRHVSATDANGKDITGIVTGMKITASGPSLKVGGVDIALGSVTEVDQPDQSTTA